MRTLSGYETYGIGEIQAIEATFVDSICHSADIHYKGAPGIPPPPDMNIGDFVVLDLPSRIIVTQVGGSTILVEAWAKTPENLEAWLPIANAFIDSIRFLEAGEPPS